MKPSNCWAYHKWLLITGLLLILSVGCSNDKPQVGVKGSSPRENVSGTTPIVSAATPQPLIVLNESIPPIRYTATYQTDTPITAANAHQVTECVTIGKGVLRQLIWSRDGQTLVAQGSESVYVFDATNLATPPRIFLNKLSTLAISSDGRLLAASTSETPLLIWDSKTGDILATPELPQDMQIISLAFSPNDDELAALDTAGNIYRWTLADNNSVDFHEDTFHLDQTTSLHYHPNGELLAVVIRQNRVVLTNVDRDETLLTLEVPDWYRSYEVSIDGSTIILPLADQSDSRERVLSAYQLFDTLTGEDLGEIPANHITTTDNPATRIYSSVDQNSLEIRDIPTQRLLDQFSLANILRNLDGENENHDQQLPFIPLSARQLNLQNVDFSPDGGQIALSYQSGEIILIQLDTGSASSIIGAFSGPFYDAWLTPDAKTIISATTFSIDLWDLQTGTGKFGVPRDSGSGLALHPDGTVFAVGESSIMLYDVESLIPRRPLRSSGRADVIAFDANGTHLAWMTDRYGSPRLHSRNLFDEDIPITRITLESGQDFVPMMAFSPTGDTIAAVHGNGNLTVWATDTMTPIIQMPFPDTNYHRLAYAPDGKSIAFSAGALPVHIIDIDDGTDTIVAESGYYILGLAYSPDGSVLALSGIDSVLLLDSSSGEILTTLDSLSPYVEQIRFSMDGTILISASSDGTIRLWGIPHEH